MEVEVRLRPSQEPSESSYIPPQRSTSFRASTSTPLSILRQAPHESPTEVPSNAVAVLDAVGVCQLPPRDRFDGVAAMADDGDFVVLRTCVRFGLHQRRPLHFRPRRRELAPKNCTCIYLLFHVKCGAKGGRTSWLDPTVAVNRPCTDSSLFSQEAAKH